MEPGLPRKIWDFNELIVKLMAALKRLTEAKPPTRTWDRMLFKLSNGATITHTVAVVDEKGGIEWLSTSPEIREIVSYLVKLLDKPPQESWTALKVEVWGRPQLDCSVTRFD